MTITPSSQKPKARKKAAHTHDPLEELAKSMKAEIAHGNKKVKPTPAPTPNKTKSSDPAPARTVATPMEMASKLQWPNASKWPGISLRIAERTQKLLQQALERNRNLPNLIPALDPARMNEAYMEMMNHVARAPERLIDLQLSFWQDYLRLWQTGFLRMTGQSVQPVISPPRNDKRFADPAWQDIWLFDYIKQSYLLTARWAQNFVQKIDGLDPKVVRKIDFYTRQMVDAISPSNFWLTNPEVLRATIESGGENLVKGVENLLDDIENGQGYLTINMSDNNAFKFGENIAGSKGKVIYQNDLIQLIQYDPLTEKAHKTPLLIVPPWINKFYILDLREKNSLIRYMVEQGHTVFCISWVNPNASHAHINFDDYMVTGLFEALREIGERTGEKKVNVTGYCIGGTLLSCALGYLEALGPKRPKDIPQIASATFLVTLVDFTEPGDLGIFTDEAQVSALEAYMSKQGYLDAQIMATTFSLLRANDLIWSFVVNNYLLGREPFPFDLLTWNSDSTNLPAAMQSFYLRNMYLKNKLVEPNGVVLKGIPIDLRKVTTPCFCISAQDDHIAPWRSTYTATQLYKGPVTFCLSGSGHIAGVINPPVNKKYGYWTNPKCPPHPDDWFNNAVHHEGSWWTEWAKWLKPHAGELIPARRPTGRIIEDAPGSYVRAKAF